MRRMRDLPPAITSKAFRAGSEYAWRRQDVRDAIEAIVRSGQAVLGWEVWRLVGERGVTHFLPPASPGAPPGIWAADTVARNSTETWADYCARSGRAALEQIERAPVEASLPAEMVDCIRFNLCYVAEGEG